ncbi:MAG TPA: cupin domain-containing protein [Chloroflexota bacterium]|nr:cupin domain-containing protein [Chloroflexota bacterium]
MPKPEYEFYDPETVPWQPVPGMPGLSERILSRDPDSGDYTRLLRFEPGADTSPLGVQRHDFWEEVLIVEGGLYDLTLDQTFTKGMYACRPPGMPHGPWQAPNGCVTFEFRYWKK